MDLFPTQYSTLSSNALKNKIEERYGFHNLTCRYLIRGVSDTYVLENVANSYIFKIYRSVHRSLTEIKGEVELLNILKEQGAKVSYPIRDSKGEQIQEFNAAEGIRYGVLFSFALGKTVYDLTDRQLRILGNEMAFNHNITSRIELQHERKVYNLNTTVIQPLKIIEPAFKDYPEGYAYLAETAGQVIKKMELFNTAKFNYGYCHYDYLPKNFHFDEHDSFTLFDFDFAGKGFLANDLTSFSIHILFCVMLNRMTKEEAGRALKVFIKGYKEVRPISEEEIEAVPYLGFMFWTFYLGFQYENFDDWSNTFFGLRFLRERIATIKQYASLFAALDLRDNTSHH